MLSSIKRDWDAYASIAAGIASIAYSVFGSNESPTYSAICAILAVFAITLLKIRSSLESQKTKKSLDGYISRRSDEKSLYANIEESVLFIQESGQKIFDEDRKEIAKAAKQGKKIEILLAAMDETTISLMSMRNASINTSAEMKQRMESGRAAICRLIKDAEGGKDNIEVRELSYPLDITGTFINHHSSRDKSKQAIVRIQGFKVPFEEKLDLKLDAIENPATYNHYLTQSQVMWSLSKKVTLS